MTADELLAAPEDGMRRELIRGVLRTMSPAGAWHEEIAAQVMLRVGGYIQAHRLGRVYGAPGFRIGRDPDTVRAPDFAFVAKGRLPEEKSPSGYPNLAPDFLVEVVSPNDTAAEVQQKVEQWLQAGVQLVWVVYPDTRSIAVYRSTTDIQLLGPNATLDGGAVLPGFTCPVAELFPD